MNDEKLLALWPCQLANCNRDEIRRAVELGYDLSKRCISDDTRDDCVVTRSHDDCIWSQTPPLGCGLFTAMWDNFVDPDDDDDIQFNEDFICLVAIDLLKFLYELYNGKIVFLDGFIDNDFNVEDVHNEQVLHNEYIDMGYEINFDPYLIDRDFVTYVDLFHYCLDNAIIDISSRLVSSMEKEIINYIDECHSCNTIIHIGTYDNVFKLKLKINALKQQNKHYSLSNLLSKTIDLEKEDLSAFYYY